MGRPAKITQATPRIERFFKHNTETTIYTYTELSKLLQTHRTKWDVAKAFQTDAFIEVLQNLGLQKINLPFLPVPLNRYVFGTITYADLLKMGLTVNKGAYLSHYTALYLHELTEQIPKTIYVSYEQKPKPGNRAGTLIQTNIDRAFQGKPRISNNVATYEDYKIILLNGKNTESTGVVSNSGLRVTDLERTLIDCVVRPFYAGGVFEVLKAFKYAKEKVSINKLQAMLNKINYIYPYKQALGFYLERAEYREKQMELLQ